MTVTDSTTGNYVIEVDTNSDGVGNFVVEYNDNPSGTKNIVSYCTIFTNGSIVGQIETHPLSTALGADIYIQRNGAVEFRVPLATGADAVQFQDTGTTKAAIDQDGIVDLSEGSLRLPIVTSLPSSPVEGQMVVYDNTSAGWTRLAVYIDSAWRMSSNL